MRDHWHKQRQCISSAAATAFNRRHYTWPIFHNLLLCSEQVNAADIPSLWDVNMHGRKSGNAGAVEEAVGKLVHQKHRLQHIRAEGGFTL